MRSSPIQVAVSEDPPLRALPGEDELPYDFGEEMESDYHREGMTLLIEPLKLHLEDVDDIYVAGNMAIYYSARQIKNNDFRGPDVFVVKHTSKRSRKSWVMWEEEVGPSVVIELLSASTEKVDRTEKMRIYARSLHVSEYFLFSPDTGEFLGYRLDPQTGFYVEIPEDEAGNRACMQLNLLLGPWEGTHSTFTTAWLRWKALDGSVLPTGGEAGAQRAEAAEAATRDEAARAEAAEAVARDEAARAEAAEARAVALEAELAALRAARR